MVFKHNGVAALSKFCGDVVTELGAAGKRIVSDRDVAGEELRIGNDGVIGNLSEQAECYECRRMRVENSSEIRTLFVDREVEGIFHGGTVDTDDSTIGLDLHDVFAAEVTLVYAGGRDPNGAFGVTDGKVAACGGGHTVIVNTVHDHNDLIGGVKHFKIHFVSPFGLLIWKMGVGAHLPPFSKFNMGK